jgi:hypothetical protein
MKVAALALLLVLSVACNRVIVPPTTVTTVVASPADVRANVDTLRSLITGWAEDAIYDPGATARVLVAGESRDGAVTAFMVAVPESWRGGDVLALKSEWHQRLRSSVQDAARRGFSARVAGMDVVSDAEFVEVLPAANSLGEPWTFVAGSVTHTAIVCDVSPSAEIACDGASLRHAYDRWMKTGVEPTSTFEVWRAGKTISDVRRVFAIQTPMRPLGDRVAFLLGGRSELLAPMLLLTERAEIGSAIAEAMAVATRSLQDKRGALSLCVLSDMRQLTPGEIDLEQGTTPTPSRFERWLAGSGLMLDLSKIHVTVCGFHNRVRVGARPLPPRRFSDLRELWRAAFASMRVRSITICGACDATAFTERRPSVPKTTEGVNVLETGTHRGARALIAAVPEDVGRMISAWGLVDAKHGRAEAAAEHVRARFPWIRSAGATGDGVEAAVAAGKHATVVATMDSVAATIDVIEQRPRQRSMFQIVGRGPGGSATGNRLGVAGLVEDDTTWSESLLFLRGLQSLTAREVTSSGALTRGGDPLTAAMLTSMRDAASLQTARYIEHVAKGSAPAAPLTLFSSSERYPLAVLRDADDADSVRSALALHTAARFAVPRVGQSVAVAFVNIADRAVRIFHISRSLDDARRVAGITELRVPARRIVQEAVFTD